MRDDWVPSSPSEFGKYLSKLHSLRMKRNIKGRSIGRKRNSLTPKQRKEILNKTGCRCHICGGEIIKNWEADHVLAHSGGGVHSVDNYLPAHRMCNNYRWNYLPEEFHEIMRLGVWLKTNIEKQTAIGKTAGHEFIKYENRRVMRRK